MNGDGIKPETPPNQGYVPADEQLPCDQCGWWVTPGYHSEANCHANQQENATQARVRSTTEERTDG